MTFRKSCALLTALLLFLCFVLPCVSAAEEDSDRLVLPENLKRIESSAFANIQATTVVFPDGIEYIAPDAFSKVPAGIGIGSAENETAIAWCEQRGWTYQAYPRYFALIIGNGTGYLHLGRLGGVANDVKAMKNALAGTSQGWRITVKENITASEMKSSIGTAFAGATRSTDVCLFYYSGHGDDSTSDSAGSLCGIDYYYGSGAVHPSELRSCIDEATPGKAIVLLDSCGSGAPIYYSWDGMTITRNARTDRKAGGQGGFVDAVISAFKKGASKPGAKTGELRDSKYNVLAACEYGETSTDGYITQKTVDTFFSNMKKYGYYDWDWLIKKGGLFTYSLIRSMGCSYPAGAYSGSMAGDSDKDKKLTLLEAYNGVWNQVDKMNSMWRKALKAYQGSAWDLFEQRTQGYGDAEFVLFAH